MSDAGAVMDGHNTFLLCNTELYGEDNGFMVWDTIDQTSDEQPGTVTVKGGSIRTPGQAFYVPGAHEEINLSHVSVDNDGDLANVVRDGVVTMTVDSSRLQGDVVADSGSTVDVTLTRGASLDGAAQNAALTLASGTTWNVTAGSALTTLSDAAGIRGTRINNIVGNGHTVTYDAALPANQAFNGRGRRLSRRERGGYWSSRPGGGPTHRHFICDSQNLRGLRRACWVS